jgi:predicted TIM-barrel fold metal-dependent hydrolase
MTAVEPRIDSPAVANGRYVIASVDGHAGASIMEYRNYLPSRLHDQFDEWVKKFENPFADIAGETAYRNWDSKRRLEELEKDGVVAEVLFPNTIPPFYPNGNLTAMPPKAGEHELRWEGLRAHNRWLAEFCNDTPGRRAGLAQILLHDVDAAVEEIKWAKEVGLFGGVLLPGIPPDSGLEPMISPVYEPIWRICAELEMPINHHSGNSTPAYGPYPATGWMFFVESGFFAHRALWMLIFAGVFDRYPNLKLILTEGGAEWAPGIMRVLDHHYNRMQGKGMGPWAAMRKAQEEAAKKDKGAKGNAHERSIANAFGGMQTIEKPPTEYFKHNVWIGSSFTSPREAAVRHEIGVDRIMWGNDYPHHEATYPFTREALRYSFSDTPPEELAQMLGANAFEVYAFDVERLRQVAVDVNAPTVSEIQVPLDQIPEGAMSQCFEDAPNRVW